MTHPIATPAPATTATRHWLLLPYVVFVVHTVEELPEFAAWASRHFAHKSTELFATVHIPLILLVLAVGWRAARPGTHRWATIATAAFAWQFGVNAVFHLGCAVAFAEYSPGMVTGAVVSIPAAAYVLGRIRRDRLMSGRDLVIALVLGTAVAAAAIGVLFV